MFFIVTLSPMAIRGVRFFSVYPCLTNDDFIGPGSDLLASHTKSLISWSMNIIL